MSDEIRADYQYSRILSAVVEQPWAILPAKLVIIRDLLHIRASGYKLTAEEVRESMATREVEAVSERPYQPGQQRVAILPLVGTIIPRGGMFSEMSGAVSVQRFTALFREALRDPDVSSIVIDVDSPGGQVGGVEELARAIYDARGQKPITAVVNALAASAAYWIATAADEVVITPSGQAGSIGVFAMHQDVSEFLVREGVKMSLISAGKYKVEGNPFEPLTAEARGALQEMVNGYYDMFTKAVARNRGVKPSDVRGGFGEGRVVSATQAVALGMADRVGTLSEVISKAGNGRRRSSSRAMAARHMEIENLR